MIKYFNTLCELPKYFDEHYQNSLSQELLAAVYLGQDIDQGHQLPLHLFQLSVAFGGELHELSLLRLLLLFSVPPTHVTFPPCPRLRDGLLWVLV